MSKLDDWKLWPPQAILEMKMRFEIHGEDANGDDDYVIVSGDTLEECIALAHHEEARHNWKNCWSKQLDV